MLKPLQSNEKATEVARKDGYDSKQSSSFNTKTTTALLSSHAKPFIGQQTTQLNFTNLSTVSGGGKPTLFSRFEAKPLWSDLQQQPQPLGFVPTPTPFHHYTVAAAAPSIPVAVPELPPWGGPQTVCVWDVETCNPSIGPVLAVGTVLGTWIAPFTYHVQDHRLWSIERDLVEHFNPKGKAFWESHPICFEALMKHQPNRQSGSIVANAIKRYSNEKWAQFREFSHLIDDIVTDGAHLNQLLFQHGHTPINVTAQGEHKKAFYNARDLIRGAFSMIDPSFQRLSKLGLAKAVDQEWKRLLLQRGAKPKWIYGDGNWNESAWGPFMKHSPVYDAWETLTLFFKMEDIKACRSFGK